MDTILLENADFIQQSDNWMVINPSITVKLSDFSQSEVFHPSDTKYRCMKFGTNILTDAQYLCPKIFDEQIYDAKTADMWSLGMILFHAAAGEALYSELLPHEIKNPINGTGYWAVMKQKIKAYLTKNKLSKFVSPKMLSVISQLLNLDPTKRLTAFEILQHQWFQSYYKRYERRIKKKSKKQAEQLAQQRPTLLQFPYYVCKY